MRARAKTPEDKYAQRSSVEEPRRLMTLTPTFGGDAAADREEDTLCRVGYKKEEENVYRHGDPPAKHAVCSSKWTRLYV